MTIETHHQYDHAATLTLPVDASPWDVCDTVTEKGCSLSLQGAWSVDEYASRYAGTVLRGGSTHRADGSTDVNITIGTTTSVASTVIFNSYHGGAGLQWKNCSVYLG
jgi:hypothetical protein